MLERLSFALVEQILQSLLQEPEAQLVTFRNQVRGEASVPDARIRASFSYWVETKTERRAVSERQLRAHLLALDAEPRVDRQRLLQPASRPASSRAGAMPCSGRSTIS